MGMSATASKPTPPFSTIAQAAVAKAARLSSLPTTAATAFCVASPQGATAAADPATAALDRLGDDMNATAMSVDTPSYARSLGMGQLGSAAGFAGGPFHVSQDLAQSMSIDVGQAEQMFIHGATAGNSGHQLSSSCM